MTMEGSRGSRRRRDNSDNDAAPSRSRSGEDLRGHTARVPSSWTVRTVTPEPIPEGEPFTANATDVFSPASPPTSPFASGRETPVSRQRMRSESNNERGHGFIREALTRPRTRTLEERSVRDASPSGLLLKGRQRLGSMASTNSSSYNGVDDAIISIGHPSVIPGGLPFDLPMQRHDSERRRLPKNNPLNLEIVPTPSPPARQPTESPQTTLPEADTEKILNLTKSLRGRMEGPLAFRRGDATPWASAYCSINDEIGSLVYETRAAENAFRTLIPDLRGCYAAPRFDSDSQMPYICIMPQNSKLKVHLRPHTQDEFESWFAALLSWRPMRPKGILNKMTKPQAGGVTSTSERRTFLDTRRHSEVSLLKEAPIIKVGKMIFWDNTVSYTYAGTPKSQAGSKPSITRMQSLSSKRWRRVSCTLRENGELKLYTENEVLMVSCIQLSQLNRCAVQRLDPSVLDNEWSIGIFPQYTTSSTPSTVLRPTFVSLESRVLYEVWLVLLRAFTVPQLYGPKQPSIITERSPNGSRSSREGTPAGSFTSGGSSTADMFRMERSLSIRVIEAKLVPEPLVSPRLPSAQGFHQRQDSVAQSPGFFAEVLLDGETRAKTMIKSDGYNPFWGEEFDFQDLPAVMSTATVTMKKTPPNTVQLSEREMQKETKRMYDSLRMDDSAASNASVTFDQTFGKVDIYLDDLVAGKGLEKWWPLTNHYGHQVGEALVRVETDESIILMARDYQPMSELLHRFANILTIQLSQMLSQELKRLSECLLNIFQVSGSASDWLMALVEEEIDGTLKDAPISRLRYSKRAGSNESSGEGESASRSALDREIIVRDMGKTASLEANLLFRGNTLLTKSLDLHMKRLGREYLEETIGDKIREIADKDPDCEVDPNRLVNANYLDRNWRRLNAITEDIWKLIAASAERCPAELRYIFRHIRACAEDRYGDFLRTVSYSSVSGFLFLRFFCPAILNPKLFGLVKDNPKNNTRRTFTLVAKSIQTLANMGTFGAKEQWMEPMNLFLAAYRQGFKIFIDNICGISSTDSPQSPIPPSYSTPLLILQRLPPTSREGFPSLPYLIDHARNFASLVDLWLERSGPQASNIHEGDGDLLQFHLLCQRLRQRTEDCLAKAERAERPSSVLSTKWDEVVEQLTNQTQQHQGVVMRQQQAGQRSNGVRSQPESPSRGHSRKLSLDIPPTEERTPSVAKQTGHPQSPVSASTAASQYQTSESHDEVDADADTTPLRGTKKATTASPDAELTDDDEEQFFGGRMNPSLGPGYALASGFAAARAEAALIKERERQRMEEKQRKRAELERDLQLSLAQPMHSSQGSVGGNSVFGPYKGDFLASSSSGRASSERMSSSAERPRSEGEKERQRHAHHHPKRAGDETRPERFVTPLRDRFKEGRSSFGDDPRSPSTAANSSSLAASSASAKKLHRGEPPRRQLPHLVRPSDDAQISRREQPVPPPPPPPPAESSRSRGPSRQGLGSSSGNNGGGGAAPSFTGSSASSDNEAGGIGRGSGDAGSGEVTALPKIRPQRQRGRGERDRDRDRDGHPLEGRNPAAEKSLVDRLLSNAGKKKK